MCFPLRRDRNSPPVFFLQKQEEVRLRFRRPFHKSVASYGGHLVGTNPPRQQLITAGVRLKWRAVRPRRRWPRERLQREARYDPDAKTARDTPEDYRAVSFGGAGDRGSCER
jgi:hypothetical protein